MLKSVKLSYSTMIFHCHNNSSIVFIGSFSGCDWTVGSGYYQCCSDSNKCGVAEGNCKKDDDCLGNLLCGEQNCFDPFPDDYNCCYDPFVGKKTLESELMIRSFLLLV